MRASADLQPTSVHLHFTQTESTFSYFDATRAYLERHGKAVALYSDRASVFRSVSASKTGRSVTHFGRAMYGLNIDTFGANSRASKGRVERAHLNRISLKYRPCALDVPDL